MPPKKHPSSDKRAATGNGDELAGASSSCAKAARSADDAAASRREARRLQMRERRADDAVRKKEADARANARKKPGVREREIALAKGRAAPEKLAKQRTANTESQAYCRAKPADPLQKMNFS